MANDKEFNGSDPALVQSRNGVVELENFNEEGGGILRSYFALLALRHRRLLITASAGSMAAVFCLTFFVMHPKYQATAVIRPVGQSSSGVGSLLKSTGLSSMGDMTGTGIDSDIGTNVHEPDELVTILTSYTFTTAMIQAENLGPKLKGGRSIMSLLPHFSFGRTGRQPSLWSYYRAMSSRFDCENSIRTGNITLTFIDKDTDFAIYILNLYIDRLRDQLRAHDVFYNKAAAKSLEAEAAAASDPLMRDNLYDLVARQVKKIKTAEANADFAFTVMEKPYTPPYPVQPLVVLDTLFAGIAIPLFIFAVLVVRDWTPRVKKDLAEAASESERIPDSIAVSRRPRRAPTPEDDRPYTG